MQMSFLGLTSHTCLLDYATNARHADRSTLVHSAMGMRALGSSEDLQRIFRGSSEVLQRFLSAGATSRKS